MRPGFRPRRIPFRGQALGNGLTCSGEIAIEVDDTDPPARDVDGREFSTSTVASTACVTVTAILASGG